MTKQAGTEFGQAQFIMLRTSHCNFDFVSAKDNIMKIKDTRLKSKMFSLERLILLIWTNVPRTNVACTNVVVTV